MSLSSVKSETALRSRAVLELKLLQALDLLNLQPAKLLTPAIVGHLAHTDLPDRLRHALALRDQNIDLAQLRDDLFGLVALPCHYSPPGCQRHTSSRTTSMGADQRHARGFLLPLCIGGHRTRQQVRRWSVSHGAPCGRRQWQVLTR